jgi:hypothetical protein
MGLEEVWQDLFPAALILFSNTFLGSFLRVAGSFLGYFWFI